MLCKLLPTMCITGGQRTVPRDPDILIGRGHTFGRTVSEYSVIHDISKQISVITYENVRLDRV